MTRFSALVPLRRRLSPQWKPWLIHLALMELALAIAFFLRFEFTVPPAMRPALLWALGAWLVLKMGVSHCFGLHLRLWRYFSARDLKRLVASNIVGSLSVGVCVALACPHPFPRSVIAIDFFLAILFTAGIGTIARLVAETTSHPASDKQTRTLIFDAGSAGVLLLRESRQNSSFTNHICGFIDDDERKRGRVIHGIPVLGAGVDLQDIVRKESIQEVLIALPSARGPQMRRIVELCRMAGVAFRTMPAMSEIISSQGLGRQLREVAVEDLLGRAAIQMDRRQMERKLQNRVALVTGAAGSIGSELCRQIAACRPGALVAFDISESALFHIERELRRDFPDLVLYTEIGSTQNRQRLEEICALYRPHIVYHAAAYKHVPMMEANVFEAVENNIVGTFHVASVAREYGVEDLVMISTDKAVHPTSVMGVTKRISELIVRSFQDHDSRHVSVRFGNVLGSNGSVLPIFKDQIAAGGPVTVTHPGMHRYFMTIPEAVQLVLQGSGMGKDVRIEFTGLRPGEKLQEELSLVEEQGQPTHHPKIKVFAGASISQKRMIRHLTSLRAACMRRDLGALVDEMKLMVPDYTVSQEMLARMEPVGVPSDGHSRKMALSLDQLREALQTMNHRDETESAIGRAATGA